MNLINLLRHISLRHLKYQKARTIMAAFGICLGVAAIVSINIVNRSVLHSFEDSINRVTGRAGLQITGADSGFPEKIIERVQAVPGVEYAVPVIDTQGILIGAKERSLMILGVDVLQDNQVRDYSISDESADIPDPLLFLAKPNSILITRSLAEREGIKIDQDIQVQTVRGIRKFRVRGILNPEGPAKAMGGNIAVMDILAAQMAFGKEGRIDRIDISLARGAKLEEVQGRIMKAIPEGYSVQTPEGRTKQVQILLSAAQRNFGILGYIAIFVGMYLIYNAVSISVVQRKKEIGILRALGATRGQVIKLLLGETAVISVVASALGVGLGIMFSKAAIGIVGEIVSEFFLKTSISEIKASWIDLAAGVGAGVAASLTAAFLPALSSLRITPISAIRSVPYSEERFLKNRIIRAASVFFALTSVAIFILYKTATSPSIHNSVIVFLSVLSLLLGVSLATPDFLRGALALFHRSISPFIGPAGRLAGLNIQKNVTRNAVAAAAILYGISIFVITAGFIHSINQSAVAYVDSVVRGDILVTSGHPLAMSGSRNIPMPVEMEKELEKIPGVLSADPFRRVYIDYSGRRIMLLTIDVARRLQYSPFMFAQGSHDDMLKLLPHQDTIVVNEGFASHFGVKPGGAVVLPTPQGPVRFGVAAVIVEYSSDTGSVMMDSNTYRRYWGDMLADTFSVRVKSKGDIGSVREAIVKKFGGERRLFVLPAHEFKHEIRKVIDQSFVIHYAVNSITMTVACLGIIITLLASVLERTREIGILRSVGMLRGQVSRIVVLESVLLGITGGGLGSAAGIVLGWICLDGFYRVNFGASIAYHIPYASLAWALLLSAGISALAGLYPAQRAAKMSIGEALSYE